MKFLTFYYPIPDFNIEIQSSILNKISESWRSKGFEVIVASEEDAMQHPLYEKLLNSINSISLKTRGEKLPKFHETSIVRWLAWATKLKNEEVAIVGDYDVFNNNLSVEIARSLSQSNLTFLNNKCLCFGSGTKTGFETWAEVIIKHITEVEQELATLKNIMGNCRGFHDQDLMQALFKRIDLTKNFNFEFMPYNNLVKNYHINMNIHNTKLECIHFSHRSVVVNLRKLYGKEWRKKFSGTLESHRLQYIIDFIDC